MKLAANTFVLSSRPLIQGPRGFTLIELLVVIAMVAILAALAIPSFSGGALRANLTAQSRDLISGAVLARSEAIKRKQAVTVCSSTDGANCDANGWENGWIVKSAANEVIYVHKAAPTGFKVNPTVNGLNTLSFDASGLGATMATFKICRSTPLGTEERLVTVSATGRASVQSTSTGSCP